MQDDYIFVSIVAASKAFPNRHSSSNTANETEGTKYATSSLEGIFLTLKIKEQRHIDISKENVLVKVHRFIYSTFSVSMFSLLKVFMLLHVC